MTVLLIDGVGRVQEREIPRLVAALFVPLPAIFTARRSRVCVNGAPLFHRAARFQLSEEPSYPPVYRYTGQV